MPASNQWIEIPMFMGDGEYRHIEMYFKQLEITFRGKPVITDVGPMGAAHSYVVYVREDDALAAALVLRNFFDIHDPALAQAFTGVCPACGAGVSGAWVCPSCEINLGGGYGEDDPLVGFIKAYGGFDVS